ncbi:MAG: MFS transporter [Acidobacteria bacterium]|nr:MFS transporter [Acidobacteriota bacterium]
MEQQPEPGPDPPDLGPPEQLTRSTGAAIGSSGRTFLALYNRDFRLFLTGVFLSNIGTWMQNAAQGWLVFQLTDSAFWLGAVGFASALPMLLFMPLAGVFADRFDRRRLMIVTQVAQTLFALALAVLAQIQLVTVGLVAVIALLSGLAVAFTVPAYQAVVHDLVGSKGLMNAVALNSTQFNLSRAIGPMLAGVALGVIGVAGCFYLNAVSFFAMLLALWSIRVPVQTSMEPVGSTWRRLAEGFRYISHEKSVRLLLGLATMIGVFGLPFLTFLPIFAVDIFHSGAIGLGLLMSATGIGAVAGALILASRGDFRRKGQFLLGAAFVFAAGLIVLSQAKTLAVGLLADAVIGWAMASFTAPTNMLIQKLVPAEMRGRVLGMYGLAVMGSLPVGNLLLGVVAEQTGAPAALAIGGTLIGLFTVYVVLFRPLTRVLR